MRRGISRKKRTTATTAGVLERSASVTSLIINFTRWERVDISLYFLQETKKEKVKEEKSADKSDEEKPTRDVDALDEVVFVLQKDGTVKRIKVSTAIQDLNYIEVTEGIKAGDEVITGPYSTVSKTLRTGLKVKVVPKEQLFEVKK